MSKYIDFIEVEGTPKTKVFEVTNKHYGDLLGQIKWYARWRQYCYFPEPEVVYSSGCLQDIVDFIKKLMADRRKARGK